MPLSNQVKSSRMCLSRPPSTWGHFSLKLGQVSIPQRLPGLAILQTARGGRTLWDHIWGNPEQRDVTKWEEGYFSPKNVGRHLWQTPLWTSFAVALWHDWHDCDFYWFARWRTLFTHFAQTDYATVLHHTTEWCSLTDENQQEAQVSLG